MKESSNTAGREAYAFLKANRKKVFRMLYKMQSQQCFITSVNHSDLNTHYKDNPNLGIKVAYIKHILYKLPFIGPVPLTAAEYAWNKIKPRFIRYWAKKVDRADGVCPQENKTKAIVELIARGFIHKDTTFVSPHNGWIIQCHIAPLVWPVEYDEQTDAIQQMEKIGMPGYTGVYTLKKPTNYASTI